MTAAGATDFDIATLRARRTNKWHKFPPDVLPAWVADMDFGVASSITAALTRLTLTAFRPVARDYHIEKRAPVTGKAMADGRG